MRDEDRLSEGERRLNLVLRPGDESVARVIAGDSAQVSSARDVMSE